MKNNTKEPEKDIVSFNQALELCSIGFDEPTFCMYEIENKQLCLCYLDEDGLYMPQKDFHAPTKSQVFRWFREKYNITAEICISSIRRNDVNKWMFSITFLKTNLYTYSEITYNTYEEAENACIDELIELCKQKQNE
jgi:hypothetical protein